MAYSINTVVMTLCVACSFQVFAEVYRWQDAQGRMHFSDTPPAAVASASSIILPQPQTYSAPQAQTNSTSQAQASDSTLEALNDSAYQLRQARLARDRERKVSAIQLQRRNQRNAKRLQLRDQQKKRCRRLRDKQWKAFKGRMKRGDINTMRRRLNSYDKAERKAREAC